jgi:heavy metal efflux system protein
MNTSRLFKSPLLRVIFIFSIFSLTYQLSGQQSTPKNLSMDEAVSLALANNPLSKNAQLKINVIRAQKSSAFDIGATELNYQYGQMYSVMYDESFEIIQHFGSLSTYVQKGKYNKQEGILTEAEQKLIVKKLVADVKIAYSNLTYQFSRLNAIRQLGPFYNELLNITGAPYNQLDSNLLQRATAETYYADYQNQQFQAEQDYKLAGNELQQLLFVSEEIIPADSSLELYAIKILNSGPDKFYPMGYISFYNETLNLCKKEVILEKSKLFPEITAGYFNHDINHIKGFQGFKVGFAVPLWFFPQKARINEAHIKEEIAKNELDYQKFNITKTIENLKIQLDKLFVQISFFRENALNKADILIHSSNQKFQRKEIDYPDYLKNLAAGLKIQLDYIESVFLYNKTAIRLESYID